MDLRPERSTRAVVDWLEAERLPVEERAARLAADRAVYLDLRSDGFCGPRWDYFANEIARYGLAVIRGWLAKRLIVAKCAEKNMKPPTLPTFATDDPDTVDELADEIVARAIARFRDEVLAKGVWDPEHAGGAASLKTFFIGQCLLQYSNVAAKWLRDHKPTPVHVTEAELALVDPRLRHPATEDVIREVAAAALRSGATSERGALVIALDEAGFSRNEIANEMGLTPDAVAGILKRERARLRSRMPDTRKEKDA